MSWIDEYKGEGPWPFIPQPDKPHYNEGNLISSADNPVWETNFPGPLVTPVHNPWCGYWGREKEEEKGIGADIFIHNQHGVNVIYGVHFDGANLSFIGYYESAEEINGLILYEDDLLTIAGNEGTAILRRIGTTGYHLPLLDSYDIFNQWDIRESVNGRLVNGSSGKIYYSDTSTVMVSLNDLVRDKRGFRNTVITGTDGNLYVLNGNIFWWDPVWHPITGESWSAFWNLIEDNICDTTIDSWGCSIKKCSPSEVDECYHNGYLYMVDWASVGSPLTKINPITLETEARYTAIYYLNRIVGHGSKIYAMGGTTTATIYCFNASDLTLLNSQVLPSGRAPDGDIEIVGNYLIVSATSYVDPDATLYKLDLDSLAILDSISGLVSEDAIGPQQLAAYDDTHVVAAWNDGVSVYNIEPLALIAYLDPAGIDIGYAAQAVVVKKY